MQEQTNAPVQMKGTDSMAEPKEMYQCQMANCGYIYNPDKGDRKGKIKKNIQFETLQDDWKCPICGAGKKGFRSLDPK